ncbi:MAG: hypothetical protein SOY33_05210 [Candidatus Onthovivens sp.]|nr:hypothetical protein [Bacilli bacterium]
MKKRFLLPLITVCTIISITIGIASFSYAWLSQVPSYEFTLSTGDYPLIVKTNGYLTDFVTTPNVVDNGNGGTGNLDYNNGNEGTLRLTRANFKTYTYSEELAKDVVNVGSSTVTATKGNLEISFSKITNNIIDSTSGLGIIGNSNNGYALNNKYFYVAFLEFIFVKQYFDAYLICEPNINEIINPDNMFKFSFLDSDQSAADYGSDYKTQMISSDESGVISVNSPSGTTDNVLFGKVEKVPQAIYTDDGSKQTARKINSLSRSLNNTPCYSYACIYGIYLDPVAYFEALKKGTIDALKDVTLSLSFDFYLCDNLITYPYNEGTN